MPKYRVYLTTTASATVYVEAENPDDAIDLAYEEGPAGICAHCSGWGQNWSVDLGEWGTDDQAPQGEVVEEVEG